MGQHIEPAPVADEQTFAVSRPPQPHGFDLSQMTDDQVLDYVRGRNIYTAEEIFRMYGGIPSEKVHATLLMQSLDSLARNAQTNKRLKVEAEGGNALAHASAVLSQLLTKIPGAVRIEDEVIENAVIPSLGRDIPDPVLVPGETDIDAKQLNYDTFFEGVHKSREAATAGDPPSL